MCRKHTLNLHKYHLDQAPPLVPDKVIKRMEKAIRVYERSTQKNREKLEKSLLKASRGLWPYKRAFSDVLLTKWHELGRRFFESKLKRDLKRKYAEYCAHGGDFFSLYQGAVSDFFTSSDRVELTKILVEVDTEIKRHVRQLVLSSERDNYIKRVIDFTQELEQIKDTLDLLNELVKKEEHEARKQEVMSRIDAIESGLGFLEPHLHNNEIYGAQEYFAGRKQEVLV